MTTDDVIAAQELNLPLAIGLVVSSVAATCLIIGLCLILKRHHFSPEAWFFVGGTLLVLVSLATRGGYFLSESGE